ncbi:hybrid sensor histidine kinase/response regulator [Hahella sp. CCB-MM4]|uniref:response regulator n=1 Tax=Hahella sp. (strain CCB-MM4) TaxID=1926491 RepID=UPI000B9ADAF0|nr:response regulator [Hahella sp. CCB-MM4]OZG73364.1 hybrid sensor histidine kinase/response regulator [Hahella sp. CCB-MM4]
MSKRPRQWSIYRKSLFLGLIPSGLMFVCLLFFFTSARLTETKSDLIQRGQLIADQLAISSEYNVISGNLRALRDLIGKVADSEIVHQIRVLDMLGDTLATAKGSGFDADRDSLIVLSADIVQAKIELPEDTFSSFIDDSRRRSRPITVGRIEVSLNEQSIIDGQNRILFSSAAVASLLFLLTFLVVRNMARSIADPIEVLTQQVEQIKDGDYETRVPEIKGQELSQLRDSINRLALELDNARTEHQKHIVETEKARIEAESASRAKSEFLAIMSHELRTPINGVLGMLQLLKETSLSNEQSEFANIAERSTEQLTTVIDDILDYSKMERGRLSIDLIEFNLKNLIHDTVNSLRPKLEEKGLHYEEVFIGPLQDALVTSDPGRLRQVLANIFNNAIKFTEQGHIRLQATWSELGPNKLMFTCSIEDSGIGIAREQQKHMFNSFSQVDQSPSRRYGGTGLGLSIAKRILELLQGRIEVESELEKGSLFTFSLELHYRHSSFSPNSHASVSQRKIRGRALVVEDNLVNQKVAAAMLEKLGLETELAQNGEEALKRFKSNRYDLIFMDCQMPVMDGFQATRAIRSYERSSSFVSATPIIAITANAMDGVTEQCMDAGMNDYLAKPIKKDQLEECIKNWLDKPKPENTPAS